MHDIPAIRKEGFAASTDDYVRKLHFELIEYIMPGMSEPKKLAFDWPSFDNYLLRSKLWKKYSFSRGCSTNPQSAPCEKARYFSFSEGSLSLHP
jgi:hypothetical protein